MEKDCLMLSDAGTFVVKANIRWMMPKASTIVSNVTLPELARREACVIQAGKTGPG